MLNTLAIISSIASIIGLILYFLPNNASISIKTKGDNSPAINSAGNVNVEYNNYNGSVVMPQEQNIKEKNKLRHLTIKYELSESEGLFSKELYANLEDQTYSLIKNEDICLEIADQKDFDDNGSMDVLLTNVIACGGNCCANSFFFYSYLGDGHFQRSNEFGYSWREPQIEKWKGRWSVLVKSNNEGCNQDEPIETKERYILDDGKAVKVEESERKGLVALIEMKSDEFDMNKNDEVKNIYYDIDNDGVRDKIEGSLWIRWGRINWKVEFSSGKSFVSDFSCKRIGVAKSLTKGVHDIICEMDDVFKWDGNKFVNVKYP